MHDRLPHLSCLLVLLATFAGVASAAEARRRPAMNPHAVTWSSLEYRATKLFLSADAAVAIEHLPARRAAERLRATTRDDDLQPSGPVGRLTTTSKLGGRRSDDEVFFALVDGNTFERRKRRFGKSPYARSERYTDAGVDGERRRPGDGMAAGDDADSAGWPVVDRRFEARSLIDRERALVHPLVLFYLASAGRLNAVGDRIAIDAYADHRFLPIDLEVAERREMEVNYTERDAGGAGERRVRKRVPVLRITVRDASDSDSDLGFLGLESGIEIFVTHEGRIPVLVRGRLGGLGQIDIRLKAATLRPPSQSQASPGRVQSGPQ